MNNLIKIDEIQRRIFAIRGKQLMLDRDLAQIYRVETKNLNLAVKRNIERFPENFRFQITEDEYENLRFQNATSSSHGGRRYLPYVFSEQGVSMLSAVLRSETAVKVSIQIMNAFVEMRKFIATNALLFQQLDSIETKQKIYQIETDEKFEKVFKALEDKSITPKQGIFYDGQIFDAYTLTSDIIRSAKSSIILIDNYVDDTVLKLFTKRKKGVKTTIYCKTKSKVLEQDVEKHNSQYEPVEIKPLQTAHDRFLIIDEKNNLPFWSVVKRFRQKMVRIF